MERVKTAGRGRVDITVGSALDIFGGKLPYSEVLAWHRAQQSIQAAPVPVPA
jgi:phosphoribosylformimino-5-aminoimidazole carboxamide ribotide isomerase